MLGDAEPAPALAPLVRNGDGFGAEVLAKALHVHVGAELARRPLLVRDEVSQLELGALVERLGTVVPELRNGDGRQDADDGGDDQELDQREALLILHDVLPFFVVVELT